jgi:hypothetical protein
MPEEKRPTRSDARPWSCARSRPHRTRSSRSVPPDATEAAEEAQVLRRGELGIESEYLGSEADSLARRGFDRVDAVDANGSRVAVDDTRDQVHERRLARAVRAKQTEGLAAAHRQVQPVDRRDAAVNLEQSLDLDERRARPVDGRARPKIAARHAHEVLTRTPRAMQSSLQGAVS